VVGCLCRGVDGCLGRVVFYVVVRWCNGFAQFIGLVDAWKWEVYLDGGRSSTGG